VIRSQVRKVAIRESETIKLRREIPVVNVAIRKILVKNSPGELKGEDMA
jgi:hypothetical protein